MAPTVKASKATKVAASLKKGSGRKATVVHTKTHFYKPTTLKKARTPKSTYVSNKLPADLKKYDIIKNPLTSEASMKKIEESNTLTFIVDIKANKRQIKDAVANLYDIKAAKVNTLIR